MKNTLLGILLLLGVLLPTVFVVMVQAVSHAGMVRADAAQPIFDMAVLSLAFMALTFAVFAVYGVAAGLLRAQVLERPNVLRWMRRSFAAAFGGLAAKLAFTER